MIAAHWLSARAPSPLFPGRGGRGWGWTTGCTANGLLERQGRRGAAVAAREGRGGWRDACSRFPYRRGTVVCAFMKICQTHPRPLPHPLLPHGSFVVPLPVAPFYPPPLSPWTSCNDRIRASGGRSLAIVVFPRFHSRCDRCIIAKCTILTRNERKERGKRERCKESWLDREIRLRSWIFSVWSWALI